MPLVSTVTCVALPLLEILLYSSESLGSPTAGQGGFVVVSTSFRSRVGRFGLCVIKDAPPVGVVAWRCGCGDARLGLFVALAWDSLVIIDASLHSLSGGGVDFAKIGIKLYSRGSRSDEHLLL